MGDAMPPWDRSNFSALVFHIQAGLLLSISQCSWRPFTVFQGPMHGGRGGVNADPRSVCVGVVTANVECLQLISAKNC